jgi:hypothetical protein
MNRNERTHLFMLMYAQHINSFSYETRRESYLRAENAVLQLTGKRQYNSYATFRASLSRYERTKRKVKIK